MLPTHPLYQARNGCQSSFPNPAIHPPQPPPPPLPPLIPPPQAPCPPPAPPQMQLSFFIPLNIGVSGCIVSCISLWLPTDILSEDFISCLCAHMDLNPTDALLGYKFSGDPVWTPPYHLSNDGELCEAINKGVQKMQRARTQVMFIEVHNLVCHIGTQIPAFAKYIYILVHSMPSSGCQAWQCCTGLK